MIVSIIVAIGKNGEIGLNNKMPWHIPADLKRFKKLTMGHHIIVGRKTYESIGGPLAGRVMIVLTNNKSLMLSGDCLRASSLESACAVAKKNGESELFICGGANVYAEALKIANKIYLTRVDYQGVADAFFPPFDFSQMRLTTTESFDKKDYNSDFSWVYETYDK
ncbi:MAG: hypothetical protein A2504_12300 [Bdellovibrionales bacterium RIFOXYD12_FULL_39_22]|nr:MAG: hypothetical protein A2385_09305 [Bdellovibrionales bacterium RIFOXYB1_FULL_39_21]OFZ44979.1 MAG: hypothetical protein A2485_14430 [Bdellovibrionales bacterium RIFOXYC12_FULL_39_17]OFZ49158.1 MAG: hypothetical protein A2404_07930 [Bdellovibrionales bacterium RIFOXYC1_FULL_39_130]OFZ74625.1 MAG: hypothetical protein A2451_08520 [Bdellovibrionales bacterium RIFOXYC2_FULL_39_8]OFZ76952.1 MAG: hypothetical protein A2560_03905 [Bdellovibrionales bacterium RIFOXYD1_FULL_39_84]OFZ96142.1 MAG: